MNTASKRLLLAVGATAAAVVPTVAFGQQAPAPQPTDTATTPTTQPEKPPPTKDDPDKGSGDKAPTRRATRISIAHQGDGAFAGSVKSSRSGCRSGRRVALYRDRKGKPDRKSGSTTSGSGGKWKVTARSAGKYYAKVGANKSCTGAVSRGARWSG